MVLLRRVLHTIKEWLPMYPKYMMNHYHHSSFLCLIRLEKS
nr:MAG TPA: hypothetical protein [Caudoviricetes sp.]